MKNLSLILLQKLKWNVINYWLWIIAYLLINYNKILKQGVKIMGKHIFSHDLWHALISYQCINSFEVCISDNHGVIKSIMYIN